jgi:hypothetical protein
LAATLAAPNGGTPTAETLLALTPELAGFSGPTFAILATDGGPNCNFDLSCAVDQCTANIDEVAPQCVGSFNCCTQSWTGCSAGCHFDCLDGDRTVAAVAALASRGVPTFIIGEPGSEAYASVLNAAAQAGRTARPTAPYYYPVGTVDERVDSASLVDALTNIANRIAASCALQLVPPVGDPDLVNVVIEGNEVPQTGANGWTVDGQTVTLLGQTCDQVLGEGEKPIVTLGCPTLRE